MAELLTVTLWIIHVKVYLLKLHYITYDAFLVLACALCLSKGNTHCEVNNISFIVLSVWLFFL